MKNKNEIENQNSETLAAMGIGAMIVFIALILVAAVASAVIIQTAEKLQQNAQTTGDQTQDQMASKLLPQNMVIDNNGDLKMTWELAPGSETIAMAQISWAITCAAGTDAGTLGAAGANTAGVSANAGAGGALPGQVYQSTLVVNAGTCPPTASTNHYLVIAAGNAGFTYEVLSYGSAVTQGTVVV